MAIELHKLAKGYTQWVYVCFGSEASCIQKANQEKMKNPGNAYRVVDKGTQRVLYSC